MAEIFGAIIASLLLSVLLLGILGFMVVFFWRAIMSQINKGAHESERKKGRHGRPSNTE